MIAVGPVKEVRKGFERSEQIGEWAVRVMTVRKKRRRCAGRIDGVLGLERMKVGTRPE
jgi:hypothetical protein